MTNFTDSYGYMDHRASDEYGYEDYIPQYMHTFDVLVTYQIEATLGIILAWNQKIRFCAFFFLT